MSKIHQQIRLNDGRNLGFAEFGDLKGTPILYFHGWPGSRLSGQDLDAIANRYGARIISPDRPGMGLSDFKFGRQILDWPKDVTELADYLQLRQFAVVGTSGGAPYVAACALRIPERLTKAAIVGGLSPFNVPNVKKNLPLHLRRLSFASQKTPWLMRFFLNRWRSLALRNPERFLDWLVTSHSKVEMALPARPGVKENYIDCFLEANRFGTRGSTWEMGLLSRPWGFNLEEISMTIYLWHGEEDGAAPPAMGRYLANVISNCQAKFIPGEGHTSLFLNHAEEIFSVLMS